MEVRHKRGEVRSDGKIFWVYQNGYKNRERWINKKSFDRWSKKEKQNQKKRRKEKASLIKEKLNLWRIANKNKWNAIRNRYRNKKRATDPTYLLCERIRNLTTQAFRVRKYSKKSKTHELLGCDWIFLKTHIEKQFKGGMSWDNRDKWHIDHIIPLATSKSQDGLEKLCHWTNLQPLWAIDNLKKKKYIHTDET
jgi:hypothetical protein